MEELQRQNLPVQSSFIPSPHLLLINQVILRAVQGEFKRIIFTCPPRHGKSMTISQYTPAWFIGRFPDSWVLHASYQQDFSKTWGGKTRDVLCRHGDKVFGIKVKGGYNAGAGYWEVKDHKGGMKCAGVGGSLTGSGGHLVIVDDPIKNAQEALSAVTRESIWQWYQSTLLTRLEPEGILVIMMTRWHEDDLVGRIIREAEATTGGEEWVVINLPALGEKNDILKRRIGEPLFPQRYPIESLVKIRKGVSHVWWSAMFQGRPSPEGGGMFKRNRFKYFSVEEEHYVLHNIGEEQPIRVAKSACFTFQTVDTAQEETPGSDYTSIQTNVVTPDNKLLIFEIVWERMEVPDQWTAIQAQKNIHPGLLYQGVEKKQSGHGIIQMAKRAGMPIRELKANTNKVLRATPLSLAYENGQVYHRQGAHWLSDFEDQLLHFPKAKYDDMVDTSAYAWLEIQNKPMQPNMPVGYEPETKKRLGEDVFDYDDNRDEPGRDIFKDMAPRMGNR